MATVEGPVLAEVSAHGSASDQELPAGVLDLLDDSEQVEGRAGQAVNPRHRHHVTGGQVFQQPEQLAPVGLRAAGLLTVKGSPHDLLKILR